MKTELKFTFDIEEPLEQQEINRLINYKSAYLALSVLKDYYITQMNSEFPREISAETVVDHILEITTEYEVPECE